MKLAELDFDTSLPHPDKQLDETAVNIHSLCEAMSENFGISAKEAYETIYQATLSYHEENWETFSGDDIEVLKKNECICNGCQLEQ